MLFLYKPDFQFQPVKVEKKVRLPDEEFEKFLQDPLADLPCIAKYKEVMRMDTEGVYHCLLVAGERRRDGILVESDGYDYARYASYVPDTAALEYDSLSEFGAGLSRLADQMIQEGTNNTGEGNWVFYFDEIQEECGFSFSENPTLTELLADMLVERPEVSQVDICSDCLDLCFYLDYCPNCQEETWQGTYREGIGLEGVPAEGSKEPDPFPVVLPKREASQQEEREGGEKQKAEERIGETRLKDLLCTRWENLHLVHDEIDYGLPHTIVELDGATLTAAGKEAWADVLDAKVVRIFQGYSGLQMELSGVKAGRLEAFSAMLAGYCSVEDYENWVNDPEEGQAVPVMQEG